MNFSDAKAALIAHGYKVDLTTNTTKNCAAHSHDQVHDFFLSDPCNSLTRAAVILSGNNTQNAVLVAISWVSMPSASAAEQYGELVQKPTTGDINELSRESGPYMNVRFTGQYFDYGVDGTAVWEAQVQPVGMLSSSVAKTILRDSLP